MALPLLERALDVDANELVRMGGTDTCASSSTSIEMLPSRPLQPGEQYRFHFDMTKCIGCRSCEIACNEQNGNPANIQWRRVGELEGGVYPDTMRTYLSMSCNHCVSPDCLRGCPVNAYSKDPLTGIVLHSADACIGCQYCVWNCPYSVPKFNAERGVVGKCDMCRDRLLDGDEPACVDACPESAIQIEIVDVHAWVQDFALAESPGLPAAGQTISTTRLTLPQNTRAALERVDTAVARVEDAHGSLVLMTAAMQAAFGTLAVLLFMNTLDVGKLAALFALTVLAMSVSVLHLGRPAYAWRAMQMWRRSWLSREVVLFGMFFAGVSLAFALSLLHARRGLVMSAAWSGGVLGLLGTLASAWIYRVKARPSWNTLHTQLDFLLSAGLLGTVVTACMPNGFGGDARTSFAATSVLAFAWTANSVARVLRLRASGVYERRASYHLMRSEALAWKVVLSWMCALGTVLFAAAPLPWLALGAACAAVMLGRYLFFVSVVPLSMALTFFSAEGASA